MTIHPRHVPLNQARCELSAFLLEWNKKYKLTLAEETMLLLEATVSGVRGCVKEEHEQMLKKGKKK